MRITLFLVMAAVVAVGASPGSAALQAPDEDELVLREAERIEQSLVRLIEQVRRSTVTVIRYQPRPDSAGDLVPAGVGSGVLLSRSGQVLTNVHVIEDAARVEVVLHDGTVLAAEVHAEMKRYDFALLLVKGSTFAPGEWANTATLVPGEWAIAVGNPRALAMRGNPVVTLGIVSGLGRTAPGRFDYGNAIQTDAEINPGNSGGPLFDLKGRILGINGKIATLSSANTSVGVGYSIPARQIQNFLPQLAAGDVVEPGYSGLQIIPASHPEGGVEIRAVDAGSPAAKVGLRGGDRIVGLNSHAVDTFTTWVNEISMLPAGRKMTLRYQRAGRPEARTFVLAREPDSRDRR